MEPLLPDVKNYLDITWDDPESDRKLSGIIDRGREYLKRAAGIPLDFSIESKQRELLFEYCRYVRDDALDEFQANFLHELMALQLDSQVNIGTSDGGGNPPANENTSKILHLFYLPDNLVGGFTGDGTTISYAGGAVRYYCHGSPEISGTVTVPPGSFPYAHSLFILFDTENPFSPISTGPWPEKSSVKVCGFMHDNTHLENGNYVRVKVVELFGMGTQVWRQ